jgi:hypothetical protein
MDLKTYDALIEKASRAPDEATALQILLDGGCEPYSAREDAGLLFGSYKGDVETPSWYRADENHYQSGYRPTVAEAEEALRSNDPEKLRHVLIGVARYWDRPLAEEFCRNLASHENERVRGFAIQGFAHLVHGTRMLSPAALAIIEHALSDPSEYVREKARSATQEVDFLRSISYLNVNERGQKERGQI